MAVNLVLFLLLLSTGTSLGVGPIRVSDDFESGNLGNWRVEEGTRLVFTPPKDYDQDRVNTAVTWFYGRLENTLHREVTIQMVGLDYTVYNGEIGNILPFERNTVPVFSYDGSHWERFADCRFDKESRTFTIRHIFSRDQVWIAYVPPYTFSRLEALLQELRDHPGVRIETIGHSVQGRPLYLVTVAPVSRPDAPVCWIQARQHSFETGGSWAVEGLLRFLVGSTREAAEIRRSIAFKICPMLNPDGVVNGGTRFNARGVDLNRHWNPENPLSRDEARAPEISRVKQVILQQAGNGRVDLFINIHNNDMVWNEDGDYIRFAPSSRQPDAARLEAILRRETIFTGPFLPASDPSATESVVAADTGALSLLMEMKTGYLEEQERWTGVDVFLGHGRNLAKVAYRFFEDTPPADP